MAHHVIDMDDFDSKLKEAGVDLVVVYFYATWHPCEVIAPQIERIVGEMSDVMFLMVDVDECEHIAMKYNIFSKPAFVFIKSGDQVDSFIGPYMTRLRNTVQKLRLRNMAHCVEDMNDFDSKLDEAGDNLVVVDFYATMHIPCELIASLIERMVGEMSGVMFLMVDVDKCEDIAMKYNIISLPTFVFIKSGDQVDSFIGTNMKKLKDTVQKLKLRNMAHCVEDMNDFDSKLKEAGDNLVVVNCYVTSCFLCDMIAPHIETMVGEMSDVMFLMVDVEDCDEILWKYKTFSMPTFIFFKSGDQVDSFSGANVKKLKDTVQKLRSPAVGSGVGIEKPSVPEESPYTRFMAEQKDLLLHCFQYLNVQELATAGQVCLLWQELTSHKSLWETVRMKNLEVNDWEAFAATLKRGGTKHLDLRNISIQEMTYDEVGFFWSDCMKALSKVSTLEKLELCSCTSSVVEQMAAACPHLESITATTIKEYSVVDLINFGNNLTELKLRAEGHMTVRNWPFLQNLTKMKQLSITSIKNMEDLLRVVGKLTQLEDLELGELTNITESSVISAFSNLKKLKRLRLEKGVQNCPTDKILETISQLPALVQLELINFDVKGQFDESLGLCSNIQILLIIPTNITQWATTNYMVINGVSKLSPTLSHFMWGLSMELRVTTDLDIEQRKLKQKAPGPRTHASNWITGDIMPVLFPSAGLDAEGKKSRDENRIVPMERVYEILKTRLPTTKIIFFKVPLRVSRETNIASKMSRFSKRTILF